MAAISRTSPAVRSAPHPAPNAGRLVELAAHHNPAEQCLAHVVW